MASKRWSGPTAPFPVDPGLLEHPKYLALSDRARIHLIELWMSCWIGGHSGLVAREALYRRGPKVALALINGWVEETADREIFYLHDYLEYHPPKAERDVVRIFSERASKSGGGRIGMHNRWHVARGLVKPGCVFCD